MSLLATTTVKDSQLGEHQQQRQGAPKGVPRTPLASGCGPHHTGARDAREAGRNKPGVKAEERLQRPAATQCGSSPAARRGARVAWAGGWPL
eukprot:10450094-Alexandrium_andersonii.AAC.1